jgi:hypothetical protein
MAFKIKGMMMGGLLVNSKVRNWLKEREGGEASAVQVVPEEAPPISDFSNTDGGSGALSYSAKFRKKRNKLKNKS